MKKRIYTQNKKDVPVGIKLPLTNISNERLDKANISRFMEETIKKSSGIFAVSYSTKEQIRYNIKNLILTQKGERKLNLNFGINWNKYFFNQSNDIIIEELKDEIKEQVLFWLPFIDSKTDVKYDSHVILILIKYKLKAESEYNEKDSILFNVSEGKINEE